jgi:hypothetical protein
MRDEERERGWVFVEKAFLLIRGCFGRSAGYSNSHTGPARASVTHILFRVFVSQLVSVKAYNVEDLKALVAKNTAMRQREMLEAEVLLHEEADAFNGIGRVVKATFQFGISG